MTTFLSEAYDSVCKSVGSFNQDVDDFLVDKFEKLDEFTGSNFCKQNAEVLKTAVKVTAAVAAVLLVVGLIAAFVKGGFVVAGDVNRFGHGPIIIAAVELNRDGARLPGFDLV